MAKNTVPEAKEALNRFKMEAASEVGVPNHLENEKIPILCAFRELQKMALNVFKYIKTPKFTKKYIKQSYLIA